MGANLTMNLKISELPLVACADQNKIVNLLNALRLLVIILSYFVTILCGNVKRPARASGPLSINEKPEIIDEICWDT